MPRAVLHGVGLVALLALVAFPEHRVVAAWGYDCGSCFVDGGAGVSRPYVEVTIGDDRTYAGKRDVVVRSTEREPCGAGFHTRYSVVRRESGPAPRDVQSELFSASIRLR